MLKLLIVQSLPNIVSLLSISLYQVIDSIFIGKYLGETGLAAQGIFSAIEYLLCTSLPVAFSIGAVTMISPALSTKDIKQADNELTQFLYQALMYIVLIPVVFLPWYESLLRILGCQDGEMMRLAKQYSFCLLLFGPLIYFPNGGFLPLFRCENRATVAMCVQVTSSILTLIIDIILFPSVGTKLELYTAVIATAGSLTITGLYTCLNYFGAIKGSVMHFAKRIKPKCKSISVIII